MNELKKMSVNELEDVFNLATYAFNAARTEKRKERLQTLMKHSQNYGYFENEVLTSQILATEFQVNFYGTVYTMAGIGYVASYPEYRGTGSISKIMAALLNDLAQQEVALAYLAPFSYPFYRQYGFEQLFEQVNYTIAAIDWPAVKKQPGQLMRTTFAKAEESLQTIYAAMPKNQRGGLIRAAWWWTYVFGSDEANQYALYKNELGECTGYLIYQVTKEAFLIKDWGYLDQQSFYALARFVGSHNGAVAEFSFTTSFGGENLTYLMPAPQVTTVLKPYMMGRIVNLETFIQAYPFAQGAAETYELVIEDTFVASNNGTWLLEVSEQGCATLSKEDTDSDQGKAKGKIIGNIQQITQLFMGYRKPSELYFFGKILGDAIAIAAIEQRVVDEPPLLADYF